MDDAGPAGRVRCWQVQCQEPKRGHQKVQLSSKMEHFAHLGMLFIYELPAGISPPWCVSGVTVGAPAHSLSRLCAPAGRCWWTATLQPCMVVAWPSYIYFQTKFAFSINREIKAMTVTNKYIQDWTKIIFSIKKSKYNKCWSLLFSFSEKMLIKTRIVEQKYIIERFLIVNKIFRKLFD